MLAGIRSSLELRMIILAGTGLFVAFAVFAGLSTIAVDQGMRRTIEERRILARVVADRVAYLVQDNLDVLQEASLSAQFGPARTDVDVPRRALHDAYLRSFFSGGVYLLNAKGDVLLAEPEVQVAYTPARIPFVSRSLEAGKPIVSDAYRQSPSAKITITALLPLRNEFGDIVAVLGGDVDAGDRRIEEVMQSLTIGTTGYAQIVDSAGNVVAGRGAGQPVGRRVNERMAALVALRQTGVGTCHDCHQSPSGLTRQNQVIGYAPISSTGWSVFVRQSEEEALLPTYRLRQILLFVGLPLFLITVAVAWGTARSVVRPLSLLARSAERIAAGDLTSPVPQAGEDEIGRLARTFETMRTRLQESLLRIQGWNAELEERVRERTIALQEQENVRRELLRKAISAQEEERRRIARELHDETSQSLAALIVAADTAAMAAGDEERSRERIAAVKSLAVQILDGVHALIFDLRPSLLDDLGLVAALGWYAESRLESAGAIVSFETTGEERRLPSEVETALFRAMQEAITNVAKHAHAERVVIRLEVRTDSVLAEVEDDGQGFDPAAVVPEAGKMQGLGLLGMQERISSLRGRMSVVSRPGNGTRVRFELPVGTEVEHYEANSCALG